MQSILRLYNEDQWEKPGVAVKEVVRRQPAITGMKMEAEESPLLEAITKQQPVKT
jgi:hypothetical protein